jgi:hypothetical protein
VRVGEQNDVQSLILARFLTGEAVDEVDAVPRPSPEIRFANFDLSPQKGGER